jgi:hypothetical protein
LGIDRFVVVGPGFHPEATADDQSLFAREVIPAMRAAIQRGRIVNEGENSSLYLEERA